jgi:hypothetical protein
MAEPAANAGPHLAALREEDVCAPVLDRHAAGAQAGVGMWLESVGVGVAPAEGCDVQREIS